MDDFVSVGVDVKVVVPWIHIAHVLARVKTKDCVIEVLKYSKRGESAPVAMGRGDAGIMVTTAYCTEAVFEDVTVVDGVVAVVGVVVAVVAHVVVIDEVAVVVGEVVRDVVSVEVGVVVTEVVRLNVTDDVIEVL